MRQDGGRPGRWVGPATIAAALAVTAAAVCVLAVGCGSGEPGQPQLVRIATGSGGAVYYPYGMALAAVINRELPGVHAVVLSTGASVENVQKVRDGQAELAFTQADILDTPGDGLAADTRDLRALARVYDDHLHLVVRAAGPVHTLTDLHGRRVSIGGLGSGTAVTAQRLLTLAKLNGPGGARSQRLGLKDSVSALRAGGIDAFFFSGGLPVSAVGELARQINIRLIDLGDWVPAMRQTYARVYDVRSVPHSAYQLAPVTTVGDPNYLVVRASMPEKLAHDLTRLLIQRREELGHAHPAAEWLDSRTAINTAPLELHPGAVRFYRDSKE